jgi:heptose-I-phosphate ethanolaminephosphotransferase
VKIESFSRSIGFGAAFLLPATFCLARRPELASVALLMAAGLAAVVLSPARRPGGTSFFVAHLIGLYIFLLPGLLTNARPYYYALYYALSLVLVWQLYPLAAAWRAAKACVVVGIGVLGLLNAGFAAYAFASGSRPSRSTMFAIYQTYGDEASGYIGTFLDIRILVLLGLLLVTLIALLIRMRQATLPVLTRRLHVMILLPALLVLWQTGGRSNEMLVFSTARQYANITEQYRKVAADRKAHNAFIDARLTRPDTELHVVVIGESTNRNHMGLYGYFRDTTPSLTAIADDLVIFTDVISNYSHTPGVLRKALTLADQDNDLDYTDPGAFSVLEILRAAGVRTYWLSNQNRRGVWDDHVSVLAEGADHVEFVSTGMGKQTDGGLDRRLLPAFARTVKKTDGPTVIFVHLMGTHWPYHRRYPRSFARFEGPLAPREVGEFAAGPDLTSKINAYDNAVLYNDHIIGRLLKLAQDHGPPRVSFLYFSDHGESPFDDSGHDWDRFAKGHVEIPFVFWFSTAFRQHHDSLVRTAIANRNKRFMIDELEDVMLSMAGVTTPLAEPARSPLEETYAEPEERILHHGFNYDRFRDPLLIARRNLRRLRDESPDLYEKVWAHRVNSLGKLTEVGDLFQGVELDLVFDPDEGVFEVRHPPVPDLGLTLKTVLRRLDQRHANVRLWLDLKAVDGGNVAAIVDQLLALEESFGWLRERAIVETSYAGAGMARLADAGFYVSYYLPTRRILQASKQRSHEQLEELAKLIAGAATRHRARALSFDHRVYPFVERYLDGIAQDHSLDFLTWSLSLDSSNPQFLKQLRRRQLDERIKVILVKVPSRFGV